MLTIWRRHTAQCPHSAKGRNYLKCDCPLWADGYVNGKRMLRQSLKTRDMARARKKAVVLDSPDAPTYKPVAEAIQDFMARCESEGLSEGTIRKYRNGLSQLRDYLAIHKIDTVGEITTSLLDAFRASRNLSPLTASKELQLLRQFCGFCLDRRWVDRNEAKAIRGPRNLKGNDVEPFSPEEVRLIVEAAGQIGSSSYERLRASAMILAFRYTALRLGDVAMMARDRITREGDRWRIFLRTEKNGKPIFLTVPQELKNALDVLPVPLGTAGPSNHFFWNGVRSVRTMKGGVHRTLQSVFKRSGVVGAHAHRFRHTLATELLGRGGTFEDIADILGNSPNVVRKHYAKWSPARQARIDRLMDESFGHDLGTSGENAYKPNYVN